VPKRQKWRGWTVNFARPSGIPILLASTILIAAPLAYLAVERYALTWIWWATIGAILVLVSGVCWHFSSPERYRERP
jgi:hypothetical protein